jgi:hypothetical protein
MHHAEGPLLAILELATARSDTPGIVMWVSRDRVWLSVPTRARRSRPWPREPSFVLQWDFRGVLLVPPCGRLLVRALPVRPPAEPESLMERRASAS